MSREKKLKLLLGLVIVVMWMLLACDLSSPSTPSKTNQSSGVVTQPSTPHATPTQKCISLIDGDADGITAVSISVNHCNSGTILPQVGGISITNGTLKGMILKQTGKEDVVLTPGSTHEFPNGEISWKVVD